MKLGGARAVGNSFRFTEHRSEPRPAGSVSWPQQAAEADKDAVEPLWGRPSGLLPGFCPARNFTSEPVAPAISSPVFLTTIRPICRDSKEELCGFLQTLLPLGGAQRFNPRPSGIKDRSRRQPEPHQIVAVLPGQNQVMLPAIEAPAQQRTPLIDGAPIRSQIHARAFRRCRQQKHIPSVPAGCNPELIRLDVVPLFRMKKSP
jgi:hypothetical protein